MNSQIATQQPPTTAKVIIYTSHGEIDIELWAKETPLACKNFIQHCLNGYYTNTIFHRLIPGFMIQGGDPTGTGMGGESIYGQPFKDQFHQRLKFTRRGIVAMANAGKNTNNSQFFMTFGPCEHLNKKHTIFGKVVGDTIYNLMGLQSLDTGEQDRPLDPPVIRKVKVVQHPFTDLKLKVEQQVQKVVQPSQVKASQIKRQQIKQKQKKQDLKKLKNKKKLTFDDEQQQEEGPRAKILSSHDVLYKKDATLSNKVSLTKQQLQRKRKQKQDQGKKAQSLRNTLSRNEKTKQEQNEDEQVDKMISKQMHHKRQHFQKSSQQNDNLSNKDQVLNYIKRYNPSTQKYEIVFKDQLDIQKAEEEQKLQLQRKAKEQQNITDEKLRQVREMQLQEYNMLKADELNFKKAKEGSMKERRKQIISEEKKLLSNLEKHRYQYLKRQKQDQHEGELFKKLIDFTTRLKSVKNTTNKPTQDQPNAESQQPKKPYNKISWMNHQLKFHIDSSNAYSLEQKALQVNQGRSSLQAEIQDDGGLKMQIQYNNPSQSQQQDIRNVLKQL